MYDVTTRRADDRDAAALARVHVRAWRLGYRGIVADRVLDALSVVQRERDWVIWLCSGESSTRVAEHDRVVVGFASLVLPSRDEDVGSQTAELAALYVEPAVWRAGIGSALLREAMDDARADGSMEELAAWVLSANAAAQAFYSRLGFAPDGAQRVHTRSGQTMIRLRAPLHR
jgi:ribosomal protein S18 acetylase RimI-like enzyme